MCVCAPACVRQSYNFVVFLYLSVDYHDFIILQSMAHHAWNPECKVYVGGLREEANRYDLEDAFSAVGKVCTLFCLYC